MTDPIRPSTSMRLARRLLAPVFARVDAVRGELETTRRRQDELSAVLEQLSRQVERLEAYQQVTREQMRGEFESLVASLPGTAEGMEPAEALRRRLDEALLHAEVLADQTREQVQVDLAELRSGLRLTQALVERAAAGATAAGAAEGGSEPSDRVAELPAPPDSVVGLPLPPSAPVRVYSHPAPSFDLLYRAFEDRHRGSVETIRDRQRDDYLELLSELEHADLPIADLGCGRGELVELLAEAGQAAVGVDANTGQVHELLGDATAAQRFVEADLFDWLDERPDASLRAVVSMHVVEHLPLELQVRLVFEAHRVLAPGGLLVLETPNTLSLSTAATNFWVDPTHERPVHPAFLEFLAREAGFVDSEIRLLHPLGVTFPSAPGAEDLVRDLQQLLLGSGDLALVARR